MYAQCTFAVNLLDCEVIKTEWAPPELYYKCTVPNLQNYWVFGLFSSSGILESTTCRKLDLFPSSGEDGGEDTYPHCQLGPLERANLNHWTPLSDLHSYLIIWDQVNSADNQKLHNKNCDEGAQLSRCLLPHLHLRTETDPVSETSCSLEYQTMEKVQKPSNSVCYAPSSEPFRI
jgi:hypothetical protein